MGIVRVDKTTGNYYIAHKCYLEDERLSFKAKGVMSYLFSKPDDWVIYQSEVANSSKDGSSGVRTAFNELLELGYLTREVKRKQNGVFDGYDYTLHEKPVKQTDRVRKTEDGKTEDGKTEDGKTEDGKTEDGKTEDGKTKTTNNNLTNNNLTNNNLTNNNLETDSRNLRNKSESKNNTEKDTNVYDVKKNSDNDPVAEALSLIQKEFFNKLTPIMQDNLTPEIEKIGKQAPQIVSVAIDYTKKKKKKINYLISVINNWADENITTVEQAQEKVKGKPKERSWIDEELGKIKDENNSFNSYNESNSWIDEELEKIKGKK